MYLPCDNYSTNVISEYNGIVGYRELALIAEIN